MPDGKEQELLRQVPAWDLRRGGIHKLARAFSFRDFGEAMDFVDRVAKLAGAEGHHPDIRISLNKVWLELHTHEVRGLSENDFILAAKIDGLLAPEEAEAAAAGNGRRECPS